MKIAREVMAQGSSCKIVQASHLQARVMSVTSREAARPSLSARPFGNALRSLGHSLQAPLYVLKRITTLMMLVVYLKQNWKTSLLASPRHSHLRPSAALLVMLRRSGAASGAVARSKHTPRLDHVLPRKGRTLAKGATLALDVTSSEMCRTDIDPGTTRPKSGAGALATSV